MRSFSQVVCGIRSFLPCVRSTALAGLIGAALLPSPAGAATLSSVAGGGVGDGHAATNAFIPAPLGVVFDGNGNAYVVDQTQHRIRKVASDGTITTVAGNGTAGFSGDGGAATAASLTSPNAITIDGQGNLYISDWGNQRIRRVDGNTGHITTLAGNGGTGYSGDGGAATSAQLNGPTAVAADGNGNVYIADRDNECIRVVNGGNIATFAGTCGSAGYSGDGAAATSAQLQAPTGVAVDGSGNVYIADKTNYRIRMVDSSGNISTFAGSGSIGYTGDGAAATSATLNLPQAVFVDAGGIVYIADTGNDVVRSVALNGNIATAAGNHTRGFTGDGGSATSAELNAPVGIGTDGSGNLYIADSGNSRVRAVSSGNIATFAGGGEGDGYAASGAALFYPSGVTFDGSGNMYISEQNSHRVRKVTTGGVISTLAGTGYAGFSGDSGAGGSAQLNGPAALAADGSGVVYIADTGNNRVRKVALDGTITTLAGNGTAGYTGDGSAATSAELNGPTGVAVDGSGNVYVSDTGNNVVRKIASNGTISTYAGTGTAGNSGDGGQAASAKLNMPAGLAVGAGGVLYIADSSNYSIRKVVANGVISTVAGDGTAGFSGDGGQATSARFDSPADVAVDAGGNLYVIDLFDERVRKIDTQGVISTIAGDGSDGFAGDGGAALSGEFFYAQGIAVDGNGDVYVADTTNDRVRKVAFSTNAQLSALGLSTGSLTPSFSAGTASYTATVPSGTASVTVTPTAASTAATLTVNGSAVTSGSASGAIALSNGAASITVAVVAENPAHTRSYTIAISTAAVTPSGPNAPGAPSIASVTAGDGQATVTLVAPNDDGGAAISGYTVSSSPAGGTDADAASTALVHVITGLTDGVQYTFTATATNSAGTGTASAPSAAVTPGPVVVGAGGTGSLSTPGTVNLGNGSTLNISGGTATAGSVVNLPLGSVTVNIGGQAITVATQGTGAQLGLALATVNGQQVALLQVQSGSASFSLPAGAPALVVGGTASAAGTVVTVGASGASVTATHQQDGTTAIVVASGSVSVPCGNLCTVSQNAQARTAGSSTVTVLGGEALTYDSHGALTAWTLSTTGTGAGSVLTPPSLPSNVHVPGTLYSMAGSVARLDGSSLESAVLSAVGSALGLPLVSQSPSVLGCVDWYAQGIDIHAAPQGPIRIAPNQADGMTMLADGRVQVATRGVVTVLAPCEADVVAMANALGSSAQVSVEAGSVDVTLQGVRYHAMPGWISTSGAQAGFSADASGNLAYADAAGTLQALYPAFANYAQVAAVLKGYDAASTATTNVDGSVRVVLLGTPLRLVPGYGVVSTPAAHQGDAWWSDAGMFYLNDGDGTAQVFGIR